jgi:hypothetical protein
LGLVGTAAVAVRPLAAAPRVEKPALNAMGVCPGVEAVGGAIETLIPGHALTSSDGPARIDVQDQGDSYRVIVTAASGAHERVYRDVARDCGQRARFAAVFIVLTLMPPELLLEPAKTSPVGAAVPATGPPPSVLGEAAKRTVVGPSEVPTVPTVPAPPPPATIVLEERKTAQPAAPATPLVVRIDLSAVSEWGPDIQSAPSTWGWGGALRTAVGKRSVAAVVGVAWLPREDFSIDGVRGREGRVPLDASLRLGQGRGRSQLTGELGLVGQLLFVEGLNTASPRHETRLDLGPRLAGAWRLGAGRFAPVLGLHAVWFPRPFTLETTPLGSLGKTASLELGLSLGVAWFAAGS